MSIEALISLLILILVVGIIAALVLWVIREMPIEAPLSQWARVLVIAIAVLIIIVRALPLIGVAL